MWRGCCSKSICSKSQSTLLTIGVKTPETCWDATDWIKHHLLHLVGLVLIHLSKMQGQTNMKNDYIWRTYRTPSELYLKIGQDWRQWITFIRWRGTETQTKNPVLLLAAYWIIVILWHRIRHIGIFQQFFLAFLSPEPRDTTVRIRQSYIPNSRSHIAQ
jgi:hypothetical protein